MQFVVLEKKIVVKHNKSEIWIFFALAFRLDHLKTFVQNFWNLEN